MITIYAYRFGTFQYLMDQEVYNLFHLFSQEQDTRFGRSINFIKFYDTLSAELKTKVLKINTPMEGEISESKPVYESY